MGTVMFYDAGTGETVTREETQEEQAQREADNAAWEEAKKNAPYSLQKLTVVERLDAETEATTVFAAMASMPAKLQLVWQTAPSIRSDSEHFEILKSFLTGVLGADRVAELLQPE